ncbi:MAG: phosphotransferase [Caulobacterales bacterium]
MDSDREAALQKLLVASGFGAAERRPLAGDASTRRYERLVMPGGKGAILMDAAPSSESGPCPPGATPAERRTLGWNATARLAASRVEAFATVDAHFRNLGLSAPEIYGLDIPNGFAVLEDLGDNLFAHAILNGADEEQLYIAAAEVLAHVHAVDTPKILEGHGAAWPFQDYDALALEVNADLFVEWLPKAEPSIRIDDLQRWERIRNSLIVKALGFPRAFTIRDYHAENLLWLPEREGLAKVGLLDFQDAVRGWRAWDFAMLLQDARRDVSPRAAAAAIRAYLDITGADEAAFMRELAVLGAINAMRILGIFARLDVRDGKPRYRAFMPRVWAHLDHNLRHPALAEARAFVEEVAGPFLTGEAQVTSVQTLTPQIPKTAMVLAAGKGLRMRPLTNNLPKPLVKVGGRTLIDHLIDRLAAAGVTRIVVNVHAHADQMEAHLAKRSDVEVFISDEREQLLETGGAIKQARASLGEGPIWVANSDYVWIEDGEPALDLVARSWDPSRMDACLIVVPKERTQGFETAGDFFRDENGALQWRGDAAEAPLHAFGIEILDPQPCYADERDVFSLRDVWFAAAAKDRLHGVTPGGYWMQVGDPQALEDAEARLQEEDARAPAAARA